MSEIYFSYKREELERFLNLVAEQILQENISLFIGAGASIQYGAPNWADLVSTAYKGYKKGSNVDKAQYAELNGIDIKTEISKQTSLIKFESKKEETYLNYLLNFDYKSIWTTNYDRIIESVLEQKGKNYKSIYRYEDFRQLSYPYSCLLFKINGSCDSPKTIVITKEDFINYRKSHEAYLILLKRELLCRSFLFLGCSFEDDILRICIKDILNCIENGIENYATNHFAIIVERNNEKLDFISKDLSRHYNIKCLVVSNVSHAYKIAYGIAGKVKYSSIFVSGAKKYSRHSKEEEIGKRVCQYLVDSFLQVEDFPFKFISGLGMSIGHFICGNVKQKCVRKNINRYLQMEPFPFTNTDDNDRHRKNMISKAGIFIFIFGDLEEKEDKIESSGMWKEYMLAKNTPDNIIIALPCGVDSISSKIYETEKSDTNSFSNKYSELIDAFDYTLCDKSFFALIVEKILFITREKTDKIIDEIENSLCSK